jgi:beta-phosphoglucomutase-like phosphatase (HAD superfamily)
MKSLSPPHLLMFDVDGTLVQSLDLEAKLFPRACELALGIERVSSDWSSYRTPSDAGIVAELVERHFERSSNAQDIAAVEARFLALLTRELDQDRSLCTEVSGVINMLRRVRSLPDTVLAVATAGWSRPRD